MSIQNNATRLKDGIRGLEVMTRFALAILALASGVYTYLGVRSLLDGTATQVFFAAVVYSSAVSVGIYAFWTYMLKFVPLMQDGARRLALICVMALGSAMIVAMSSWLNAAALAGSAALEQHLAVTLEGYSQDLDKSHANALAAQSLLPDIERASGRFTRLANDERASGALTGTSGSGSVVQLLKQMSAQLDELGANITGNREKVGVLFEQGSNHISKMRTLVSAPGPVQQRADKYAEEAVALTGVIAALQETSIAPSVKRAASDLSRGFIAPIADGGSEDLVTRQAEVMTTVRASVEAQSKVLAEAADEILAQPKVEGRRFVPLSSAEAVVRYAKDFIPSWAGAISIDLLPVVLVFILAVVHSAMRRETDALQPADQITAADMMRSVTLFQEINAVKQAGEFVEKPEPEKVSEPLEEQTEVAAEADDNDEPEEATPAAKLVTPIKMGQKKRIEASRG